MKSITAAILAGGLGTRLRPAIEGVPKVLAPVNHRPFISILLDQLAAAGIEKVVLLTGYGAAQVRQALGDRHGRLSLTYSIETTSLGTGGALRHALRQLDGDAVLLMNGDSFCDVDLRRFAAAHREREVDASMVLTRVSNTQRFGRVELAKDGTICRFAEKQAGSGAGLINAGIYLLEKLLVSEIPSGKPLTLERDLLPTWLSARRLLGFPCTGRFLDIGTPESFAEAQTFFGPEIES